MVLKVCRITRVRNKQLGADPGFLDRGFICIKVCGFALPLNLSHSSQISHENEIIWYR